MIYYHAEPFAPATYPAGSVVDVAGTDSQSSIIGDSFDIGVTITTSGEEHLIYMEGVFITEASLGYVTDVPCFVEHIDDEGRIYLALSETMEDRIPNILVDENTAELTGFTPVSKTMAVAIAKYYSIFDRIALTVYDYSEIDDKYLAIVRDIDGSLRENVLYVSLDEIQTLVKDEKAYVRYTTDEQSAVDNVISLIDRIGTVEVTGSGADALIAAQIAYSNLLDYLKADVTNADVLEQASVDYSIALIDNIGTVEKTEECEQALSIARGVYNSLTDAQKAHVTNLDVLEKAEADYEALPQTGYSGVYKVAAVLDLLRK